MENGYELRKTAPKGEGIFATSPFETGDIVMLGIIDKEFKENNSHTSQIGKNRYVIHKGLIPKVNHSCDPCCGIKVNETGGHNFVAMRAITIGEEITFDYAMRNYSIDHFPPQCMCGSKNCRGKITGWKNLPEDRKKAYEGFIAPYLFELGKKQYSL